MEDEAFYVGMFPCPLPVNLSHRPSEKEAPPARLLRIHGIAARRGNSDPQLASFEGCRALAGSVEAGCFGRFSWWTSIPGTISSKL